MTTATRFRWFFFLALSGGMLRPATAQTARIAQLSSGVAVGAANEFVMPDSLLIVDSVRQLSATTAREYGIWTRVRTTQDTVFNDQDSLHRQGTMLTTFAKQEWPRWVERFHSSYPNIKMISLDSTTKTAVSGATLKLKKQKNRRKKSAFILASPAPPRHPGIALASAAILILAAMGWRPSKRYEVAPA